jgi:hypothetical protein
MSSEEMFENLEPKFKAMMREEEVLRIFEDTLTRKAKDLINEHYQKEINRLSAEGYIELENVISRITANLAVAINSVIQKHDEGEM